MYDWDSAYISQVLHSPVYAGHIIYEAKPTVSMKSKKRRYIPFEERAIVPNTHEAIIPQDRWENVQRILYGRSSSFMCDKTDYDNIFKGIVRCADCGRTMLVKVCLLYTSPKGLFVASIGEKKIAMPIRAAVVRIRKR